MNHRLTWRPDRTQPLPTGAVAFHDPTVQDNMHWLQAAAAAVPNPIAEANGVLDLRPFCAPIDNQGQVSDCVADSTCSGLEFCQVRNGRPFTKLSRLFLYYNARLQTGDTLKDEGTYIRLAFSSLTTLGTCPEATWPYDTSQVFTRPSWAAYQQAYPHKTAAFYSISPDVVSAGGQGLVNAIKQALRAQHPVVFGMTVDDDYESSADGNIAMPAASRINPGGHAQLIVGYDDNHGTWTVQNSWGTDWGDNGFAHVPYAYLDASQASDLWVPFLP